MLYGAQGAAGSSTQGTLLKIAPYGSGPSRDWLVNASPDQQRKRIVSAAKGRALAQIGSAKGLCLRLEVSRAGLTDSQVTRQIDWRERQRLMSPAASQTSIAEGWARAYISSLL